MEWFASARQVYEEYVMKAEHSIALLNSTQEQFAVRDKLSLPDQQILSVLRTTQQVLHASLELKNSPNENMSDASYSFCTLQLNHWIKEYRKVAIKTPTDNCSNEVTQLLEYVEHQMFEVEAYFWNSEKSIFEITNPVKKHNKKSRSY